MLKTSVKKFKIISTPVIWIHNHLITDVVSYTPTIIGDMMRKIYIKSLSKKCGKKFTAHTGVQFFYPWKLEIGNNVSISRNTILNAHNTLVLKDDVMVGPNCNIMTANHGFRERNVPMNKQHSSANELIINEDVWIGNGVVVSSGARPLEIAKGIVIAANSVVIKSLDKEYGIYGGIPAKFIKYRFDEK